MDRMIYVAMTGAKHTLGQHAAISHNLANANTPGYRSEFAVLRAVPVHSDTLATRAFVVDSSGGADFRAGTVQETGRDLDVAVQGQGWIAVQLEDGSEAYTRNGDLHISANGLLQTRNGLNVQGDGGPISIPPNSIIAIARDGTVSVAPTSAGMSEPNIPAMIGRIKLVNPTDDQLTRGLDGLFRLAGGGEADADANVALIGGALEGSNVNVIEAMVDMISLSRQFEMHMKLLQNAEGNAQRASNLLSINS
ncbi:MAG: flagellar basal body rod protein FlgF [Betaproteobacteria bacterium]|nr:flagellar basal body rod protein FlgF [Betaproteobacteria bacterium]